jgi:hypothetical protein
LPQFSDPIGSPIRRAQLPAKLTVAADRVVSL